MDVLDKSPSLDLLHGLEAQLDHLFSQPIILNYQVKNYVLQLVFANEALVKTMTDSLTLRLLKGDEVKADAVIYIWDNFSTQTKLPALNGTDIFSYGYRGGRQQDIYFQYFSAISALSVFDAKRNVGFYVMATHVNLFWWVSASPLQVLFNWWLQSKNLQLTHAGAVAEKNKAVILSGRGGSGKTTTVLNCLEQGLDYMSEDYCILGENRVYSIYDSAKLEALTLVDNPRYEKYVLNTNRTETEKSMFHYKDIFPEKIILEAEIQATIALSVGHCKESKLIEIDQEPALKNLLSSTFMQLPVSGIQSKTILADVVSKTKNYRLILGRDKKAIVEIIRGLIA